MTSAAQLSLDEGLTALLRGDPQLTRDPYPFYARLREESPVHRLGSLVFVSTHAEAKAAYRDSARLVNRPPATTGTSEALALLSDEEKEIYRGLLEFELGYMSRKDGADHTRVRSAAQRAFTPRRIRELGDVAQQLTDELLTEGARGETFDLITLAYRLPLLVIMSMLGAPREDAEKLKDWGDAINDWRGRSPVPPELIHRAKQGLDDYRAYVGDLVERSRHEPGTDLAAALLTAEVGEQLTSDELVATYVLILFAGHETTTNLIGNGVLELLQNRGQWNLLCTDPALAAAAVEECFRYNAPVHVSPRNAAVDLELGAVEIAAGTPLWLLIGSANRDPKSFPNPDAMDIGRRPNDHLGLGHGVHFCLGGPLARLEGQVVLATLARRFPDLELAGDADSLEWSTHPAMHGLKSLPVRLGPDRVGENGLR